MKQEDKELLLKDLCERVLYSPTVYIEGDWFDDDRESYDTVLTLERLLDFKTHDYILKPYLRPMSSMTEEENKEFAALYAQSMNIEGISLCCFCAQFYYKHHIDGLGLIDKGLALEAPEGMYE